MEEAQKIPRCSPEYIKIYYEKNKDKYDLYYLNSKERKLNYYQENKENIITKIKDTYKRKRDELLEKIHCDCGHMVSKCNLMRHNRTSKHLNNIIRV